MMAMPAGERERFQDVKDRIETSDRELLRMLFPRRPGRQ
jgi:hypothetical protein